VQKPLAQSASAEQPDPAIFLQTEFAHSYPPWQSPFDPHEVGQSPVCALHKYGQQCWIPLSRHAPSPLHAFGRSESSPTHAAGPHAVPACKGGFEQSPVPGSQVPTPWHESSAVHSTGLPPTHAPAWQVSVSVQALPSLHPAPSALAGFEHWPVPGLHVPATWHGSLGVQTTELLPVHAPP